MQTPLLWHFAISHFTEKARWALDWKGIPHRLAVSSRPSRVETLGRSCRLGGAISDDADFATGSAAKFA